MQTGFDDVASQLKALSKNDGVRYTLADRAVGFEIIRAPPKDVLPLAKALADHCSEIEACSVGKLDALYRAMDEAADTENEEAQGEHLRRCLGAYLDEDSDELPSPPESSSASRVFSRRTLKLCSRIEAVGRQEARASCPRERWRASYTRCTRPRTRARSGRDTTRGVDTPRLISSASSRAPKRRSRERVGSQREKTRNRR